MERSAGIRRTGDPWILLVFLMFLLAVGTENQLAMPGQVEAYQNDAYVQRLRETLRREFIAYSYGVPGALDVRGRNNRVRLFEIVERQMRPPPGTLALCNGPANQGTLMGLGHPFWGGEPEDTIWRLVPGAPGGSLELEAAPDTSMRSSERQP